MLSVGWCWVIISELDCRRVGAGPVGRWVLVFLVMPASGDGCTAIVVDSYKHAEVFFDSQFALRLHKAVAPTIEM